MAEDNVYLGVWTNHAQGRILGATLTTTQRDGAFLIAFTGFLIPFVASRLWKLFCIALHSGLSTSKPQSAIHQQRQIILRNSTSPDSGLVSLLQVMWAWRRLKANQHLWSLWPIVVCAIAFIAVFSAAGGFSSQISVSAGNEVLLLGTNCGITSLTTSTDTTSLSYQSDQLNNAANYVQQCYSTNSSGGLSCDKFVVTTLPTVVEDYAVSCPFKDNICRGNETSIRLDTGLIDSTRHFGLNLPINQGFAYRYVLTCSPLKTDGYTEKALVGGLSSVRYKYGKFVSVPKSSLLDYTYQYEDVATQYRFLNNTHGRSPDSNYLLATVYSEIFKGVQLSESGDFIPIPSISRDDGDVTLIFLSGDGVFFSDPMNDEWYRATIPFRSVSGNDILSQPQASFIPSEAASPLGCVEQSQWCNTAYPDDKGCGPLASFLDAAYGAAEFFNLSEHDLDPSRPTSELAIATRFIWPLLITGAFGNSISAAVDGAKSLQSQTLFEKGIQYPLPVNQWQIDVGRWWNVTLACLQSNFVETALGSAPSKSLPLNDHERMLCSSQRILSNTHSNFNLFALLLTYIVSALVILVSFIAEPILEWLSRRHGYRRFQQLEWVTNESLQLHRLAQEELGLETWSGGAQKVPTTSTPATLVAPLDISNPEHPVLLRPAPEESSEEEYKPNQPCSEHNSHLGTLVQASEEPTTVDLVDSLHHDHDEETQSRPSSEVR